MIEIFRIIREIAGADFVLRNQAAQYLSDTTGTESSVVSLFLSAASIKEVQE